MIFLWRLVGENSNYTGKIYIHRLTTEWDNMVPLERNELYVTFLYFGHVKIIHY